MVKKQKEKQYQSAREHRDDSRVRAGAASAAAGRVQKTLPFTHCALTLTPYRHPVCAKIAVAGSSEATGTGAAGGGSRNIGTLFENAALMGYVMKNKKSPVTGEPMSSRDVIALHMDKDDETDRWQCPVLTKPFMDHTKIVAVVQPNRTEANVYSWEAYQELNVKPKNYEDLVSGAPFSKSKDVIVLNDPDDTELNRAREMSTFYHIMNSRDELRSAALLPGGAGGVGSGSSNVRHTKTAARIMEQLQQKKQKRAEEDRKSKPKQSSEGGESECVAMRLGYVDPNDPSAPLRVLASDVTGVEFAHSKAAASLTSTSTGISYDSRSERDATQEEIIRSIFDVMKTKKKNVLKNRKGYVVLRTNMGDVTIELHCDIAPRTCTNFLGLCRAGRYDGTVFHRLIPDFMIQGGKASSSSSSPDAVDGGEDADKSLWGADPFVDEFDDRLQHTGAGVVSMANSGPNTNKQQFFMTFKSCPHLNRKHSVFGQVVKGLDVLTDKIQNIPTYKKDRPKQDVKILGTDVLVDPSEEARQYEIDRIYKLEQARRRKEGKNTTTMTTTTPASVAASGTTDASSSEKKRPSDSSDIGRYLKDKLKKGETTKVGGGNDDALPPPHAPSLPPPKKTKFGNFDGW